MKITSLVTSESTTLSFGALHLGDQNVGGGVRSYQGPEAYEALVAEIQDAFHRGDVPELVRSVDRNFGTGTYSLSLLFRDEQRKIVDLILDKALNEAAVLYRNFYGQYATMARFMTDLGMRMPARFQMAVDFAVQEELTLALSREDPDPAEVQRLLVQAGRTGILLDHVTLEFAFRKTVESAAAAFSRNPGDAASLERFDRAAGICPLLPFQVNLWAAQNAYHSARDAWYERLRDAAPECLETLDGLGAKLGFFIEPRSFETAAGAEVSSSMRVFASPVSGMGA